MSMMKGPDAMKAHAADGTPSLFPSVLKTGGIDFLQDAGDISLANASIFWQGWVCWSCFGLQVQRDPNQYFIRPLFPNLAA